MTILEENAPVSKRVQAIIAENGFKNLYIAQKAGFTAQEFSDMLNGRRLIKACDIPKISNALGVDANYLFGINTEE